MLTPLAQIFLAGLFIAALVIILIRAAPLGALAIDKSYRTLLHRCE